MAQRGTDNLKRNILFNTVGNMVYFVCQWLITGFLVKQLAPGEAEGLVNAGLLATAASVTNIFITIASYGMRSYQVSDLAGTYTDGEYLASRAVTVGTAMVLCAGYTLALGYDARQSAVIGLFLLYKLLEAVTDVVHGCCQKRDRMDVIGISYAVRGVLAAGLFSAVYLATGQLVPALAAMTLACLAFCVGYDVLYCRRLYTPTGGVRRGRVWALLLACLPLAVYSFFNTTAANLPRLMLERVWGSETAGIYGLANAPVLVLQVGATFLFTPFLTVFASLYREGDWRGFIRLFCRVTAFVAALTAVGVVGVLVLGRFGLRLLAGETVASHAYLLPLMVVCAGVSSLVLFLCMLLTVVRCLGKLLLATGVAVALGAVFSLLLVRPYGMMGTSWATALSQGAELMLLTWFLMRQLDRSAAKGEGDD